MTKPQLVALLLCDQAFQQLGTHKWCIIGVFDAVNTPELPVTVPQLSAYVALSDFAGNTIVELVIRDEVGEVVKGIRGEIPPVPVGLFQHVFQFPDVEFAKPGAHTLELLAGGDLITLRSFRVQVHDPDPEQESAEAEALADAQAETLVHEAKRVWSDHPDADPIGLVVSPNASDQLWFRRAFELVFHKPPPDSGFAGIVDRAMLAQLVEAEVPNLEQALTPPPEMLGRVFCLVIVTANGFKFGFHSVPD